MHHIFKYWAYAPNTTSVTTHTNEVLESKQGVCQDFAHLMIGICRSLGMPARYVSGYLYNGPDSHLRGAQASHAWVEVHVPGKGWFGLDPTNDTLADERTRWHMVIPAGQVDAASGATWDAERLAAYAAGTRALFAAQAKAGAPSKGLPVSYMHAIEARMMTGSATGPGDALKRAEIGRAHV